MAPNLYFSRFFVVVAAPKGLLTKVVRGWVSSGLLRSRHQDKDGGGQETWGKQLQRTLGSEVKGRQTFPSVTKLSCLL